MFSMSIYAPFTGDADADNTVKVKYRKVGESTYRVGPPLAAIRAD